MREIEGTTYQLAEPRRRTIEGLRLTRCTFDNCRIGSRDPDRLVRISDVELVDCAVRNSALRPVHLRDVRIKNLKNLGDLIIVWGPLCERVVLEGTLGSLKINETADPDASPPTRTRWQTLWREHHARVEWALDISALRPRTLELDGIPAAKVRRDPETQIVVTRKRLSRDAQLTRIKGLDATLAFTLELFIASKAADVVLVAPTGKPRKDYQPVLAGFRALQKAGLAEPA